MELFAKKLRDVYNAEAHWKHDTPIIEALRERQLNDTLTTLRDNKEIAVEISRREEFDDLDLVLP